MFELLGICLFFTIFFCLHLALTYCVEAIWLYLRQRKFASATVRANTIFLLRISPLALALFIVTVFLFPAFLLNEPRQSAETISFSLVCLAIAGAVAVGIAIVRMLHAVWVTKRLVKLWRACAQKKSSENAKMTIFRLSYNFPVVALIGIFRPQIFIAESLLATLTDDEVAAAVAHEKGHYRALDNLKRILLRLSHDLLIGLPCSNLLLEDWQIACEIAADECAANSGQNVALNLASALVKIARAIPAKSTLQIPLGANISGENTSDIATRVQWLLLASAKQNSRPTLKNNARQPRQRFVAGLLFGILLLGAMNYFSILGYVHELTEIIVAGLQ